MEKMRMGKLLVCWLLLCGLSLLAGCREEEKGQAGAPREELVYASTKDIRDINPHLYGGEMAAQGMVFEPLVINTAEGVRPWLAESWEISPDGRVYTFHLRRGVTFSDGTPFDAEAVRLNMDAIKLMGEAVKKASELTADRQCIGAAKLVVFCNAPEDNPFMAGAFHGPGEPDCEIHVGVSGPGAVRAALARLPKDAPIDEVAELVKRTAFKITRVGQLVANLASKALGVPAGIIDLSLAPTPAIGDSVANILEEMGLETCGCCGTTACLALLNDAVKKGGVMASNHVGGLSGAFIPVSEDAGMIHAAEIGCLTIEKLEAMTAVCSVGIDMVIIPGDTTPAVISALIADEAAIGMVNSKTTAVRVIPAIGRKAGEVLDFGGLLGYGPIMPVNQHDPSVFINRGGRLPAPMQSLKN